MDTATLIQKLTVLANNSFNKELSALAKAAAERITEDQEIIKSKSDELFDLEFAHSVCDNS